MIIKFVGDIFDLLLGERGSTSRVCNLPLSEAGLDPKLLPVSFIKIKLISEIIKAEYIHQSINKNKDIIPFNSIQQIK